MDEKENNEHLGEIRSKLNEMSREDIVKCLEGPAGMQCYDDEGIDDLREVLWNCILEGDVTIITQ